MHYAYPNGIVDLVKQQHAKRSEVPDEHWPTDSELRGLVEACYHASMTLEEGRPLRFSVMFSRKKKHRPAWEYHRFIDFVLPHQFNPSTIRRLTHAVDPTQTMLWAASGDEGKLQIAGIVNIGSGWRDYSHGAGYEGGISPPARLTVSSIGPGQVTISATGNPLVTLRGGEITLGSTALFFDTPNIKDFFHPHELQLATAADESIGVKEPRPLDYSMYRRTIQRILIASKQMHHGGTILIVPDDFANSASCEAVRLKFPIDANYLYRPLLDVLYNLKHMYDHELLRRRYRPEEFEFQVIQLHLRFRDLDRELTDAINLTANFTGVDGALVLTPTLRVLGFGGEILIKDDALESVSKVDMETGAVTDEPIAQYGTRHRSAMRFCSAVDGSFAFVISQDGDTRAIRRVEERVLFWPSLAVGDLGYLQ